MNSIPQFQERGRTLVRGHYRPRLPRSKRHARAERGNILVGPHLTAKITPGAAAPEQPEGQSMLPVLKRWILQTLAQLSRWKTLAIILGNLTRKSYAFVVDLIKRPGGKEAVENEADDQSDNSSMFEDISAPIPIPKRAEGKGKGRDKKDGVEQRQLELEGVKEQNSSQQPGSMLWLRVQHQVNIGAMDRDTAAHLPTTQTATTSSPQATTPQQQQKKKPPAAFHLVAGAASGFTSAVLLQPADLLKTRVQQSRSHSLLETVRSIASTPQPLRQLWRGTLPSAIRTSVGSALYFTTLNTLRTHLAKSPSLLFVASTGAKKPGTTTTTSSKLPQLSSTANLACGAVARASVGFVMMPITVIKVRYESSYYSYRTLLHAATDIGGKEGLKGFFAGFGATAIRDAPYAGLYVVFYEHGKHVLSSLLGRVSGGGVAADAALTPSLSALTNFLSSTIAASAATMLTNPPDAIKTRLQLRPDKYRNSLQTLRLMLKEEGLRSLFDGLALRMGRKALSSALAWTVYEDFVRRAEARWVRHADE